MKLPLSFRIPVAEDAKGPSSDISRTWSRRITQDFFAEFSDERQAAAVIAGLLWGALERKALFWCCDGTRIELPFTDPPEDDESGEREWDLGVELETDRERDLREQLDAECERRHVACQVQSVDNALADPSVDDSLRKALLKFRRELGETPKLVATPKPSA